ncbi:MAG: ATP-dependent DNA helicase [Verrucomicrobiota bacterium]
MHFSLEQRTASLSVGEFASFSLGPQGSGGGPQGLWRAQLGQHWHAELQKRTEQEFSAGGALHSAVAFEVPIEGRLVHRGWTFLLNGRIDQVLPLDRTEEPPNPASLGGDGNPAPRGNSGALLREIKSVMRPLPAEEAALRADHPDYFLQLAAYVALRRTLAPQNRVASHSERWAPGPGPLATGNGKWRANSADASRAASTPQRDNRTALRAELVFVEAGSGLVQTVVLTPFDEALVFHQLDAIVEFLNLRLRATERRRALRFTPPFATLRPGQETIHAELSSVFGSPSSVVLFEAPTGYGKTGCVLEFALGRLKAGRFARLIWLTGKSTGQLQVMHTLQQMTAPCTCNPLGYMSPLPVWQVRNKAEHCVNHTFHCVRDGCDFLRDCAERWPGSGLARFYADEQQPRDLDTLRAAGREALICPYEITRAALPFQDVWVGDFNYVFAPDNRGLFFERPGFDPAETLLVVDEAHNLPARVAGACSHTARESDARLLLAELDHLRAPPALVLAVEEWTRLLASLAPAESLDPVDETEIRSLVERLARLVTTTPLDYAALGPHHSETLWQFPALADFLADTKLTKLLWAARPGQLEFTCVDAAPAIGETLRQFGGTILMSATLQPCAEFAESCGLDGMPDLRAGSAGPEIGLPSYQILHARTPWRDGAYDVAVDLRVDTTFRNRASHYAVTAATIVAMQEAARNPVAVFFPSYAYAEAVEKTLANYGSVLHVALQPKLPGLAAQTAWVEENLALSDVLFLVLGSSFTEGIDLLGGRVTHAMVVGPALPEVNAVQKARLASLDGLGREAAFRRVYQIPGLQKVNQALGRLVRAPGQKAKVLLHCRRFAEPSYASLLAADYQRYREIADTADLTAWLGVR